MNKLIFLILTISSCASLPELTPDGAKVRLVTDTPHNCKYIGTIDAKAEGFFVNDITEDYQVRLRNLLKNKAAIVGANTVQLIDAEKFSRTAEGYFCNYN